MKEKLFVLLIILVNVIFWLYGVFTLSISYKEALIFFNMDGFLHYLTLFSTNLFGQNDFGLRVPFIIFHIANLILIYEISKFYVKKSADRLLSVVIYSLLPGVTSVALLVNSATVVIFCTLLFIYATFLNKKLFSYLLLILFLFIDNSFSILYLGLIFYGIFKKDKVLLAIASTLFALSMYIYGFDTRGKPQGHFLDTFGMYSLIFSPFLFLYFFYSLYRVLIKENKSLVWFISFTTLIFSILISIRQKIEIEDFAPFVVISVPLMVKIFLASYRVRLPELRNFHKVLFAIVFSFLILNFLGTYFNKYIYFYVENPKNHFAYKNHFAKELALKFKKSGVNNIFCKNNKLLLRLKFYGIESGNDYSISTNKITNYDQKVSISYINKSLKTYYVSKINR